jgi:23S rRNA (guanosine2251-2'-O)-methyltransferase
VEHVQVAVVVNLSRYLTEVKRNDLWVWAAAGDAETPVWSADFTTGAALVFGAEGRGLRPLVRKACDDAFFIPQAGKVESLNVSVAAGVSLFEAARQRRGLT